MLQGLGKAFNDMAKCKRPRRPRCSFSSTESRKLSLVFRKLEKSGKPWVAAINGTAMGGAFELALACHRRIAADNPKSRLGLPEVKVGLFPGGGGTQRVSRMLLHDRCASISISWRAASRVQAKAMKLIDEVVPAGQLIETAKAWIKGGGKGQRRGMPMPSSCLAGRYFRRVV